VQTDSDCVARAAQALVPNRSPRFLVAVDGGGTATRARIVQAEGEQLVGHGAAGPSALGQGAVAAWRAIREAMQRAFEQGGQPVAPARELAIGIGIAGTEHRSQLLALQELAGQHGRAVVVGDAYTSLLGAHGGKPGAVIAVGTGSVGLSEDANGRRIQVGGWGFPSGDEAGGAWIGLRAITWTTQAQDGRRPCGPLARAILEHVSDDEGLAAWMARATPASYAALAPLVLEISAEDPAARRIALAAGRELARMARVLDPHHELPLAMCGGLAQPLRRFLPQALADVLRAPEGAAIDGAMLVLRRHLQAGSRP
jgi:glucosamine kinase